MLRAKISINLICVRIKIYIRYILLLSFFSQYVFSQNPDSLKQALKNATHDTVRVKLLVELSDVCEIEEIDSYVTQALVLCNKNLKNKSINSRERFLLFKYAGAALNNKGFINDQIPAALQIDPAIRQPIPFVFNGIVRENLCFSLIQMNFFHQIR